MDFMNYMTNPAGFYSSAINSMAGAGFPPANTPSSACAKCGKLCDHKDGQKSMHEMDCKLCNFCKSYTYIVCSGKCLKADRKRHTADCNEKRKLMKAAEEQKEKEETARTMQEFRSFAMEAPRPDDTDNVKAFRSRIQSDGIADAVNKKKEEVKALREEYNTKALKLRNKQLHHATNMYKQRNSLEEVGAPPHYTNCRYCKKPAKVNPKTFQINMARCSKCLLVRYCSRDCQVADRRNHKSECRDGKFQ